ncbi:MAG: extracellular solute-binding protein, partial [Chloroflexota bacterium]|nr:extracellular solute-binding protein [Chloroflexota bacterium]
MAYVSRRRFLTGGLGAVAGMAMLTACSRPSQPAASGSTGAGPASASKAQQVTLRFLTTESDPDSQRVYNAAVADYTAKNANVKIEVEYVGFDGRTEKIVTGIGAKRAPHVAQLVPHEVLEYGNLGYLSPVDDLIQETGGRERWQPNSLDGTIIDGKVHAVPYGGDGYRTLWYRTDLFEQNGLKPPTTWDEWKAAAQTLTKDTNGDRTPDLYGVALPGAKSGWTLSNYMRFLWQTGETVFDKDLNVIFG